MHDHLVSRHARGDRGRKVHAACHRHAVPGRLVAPCLGERVQPDGQARFATRDRADSTDDPPGVVDAAARRRERDGLLGRRPRELTGQTDEVVEHGADRVVGARCRRRRAGRLRCRAAARRPDRLLGRDRTLDSRALSLMVARLPAYNVEANRLSSTSGFSYRETSVTSSCEIFHERSRLQRVEPRRGRDEHERRTRDEQAGEVHEPT